MNRYEKAYSLLTHQKLCDPPLEVLDAFTVLEELVKKTVPVNAIGTWDDKCPACKSFVRGGDANDGHKFKFCPNCGQAIKNNADILDKRVF